MMRYPQFILLVLFLSLPSCCIVRASHSYYASMLDVTLQEDNGWRLVSPPPGVWEFYTRRAYLPDFFSNNDLLGDAQRLLNFTYAYFKAGDDTIALLINFTGSFCVRKFVYGEGRCATESYYTDERGCMNFNTSTTIVSFSPVAAEFDNSSVYFIKGDRRIQGREVVYNRRHVIKGKPLPHAVYNLDDKDFIVEKQADRADRVQDPFGYAALPFLFDDMTCRDFHDSIFVIDGIYHQGKRLPPLKIHMRYIDLDAVPEYRGAQARPSAEQ